MATEADDVPDPTSVLKREVEGKEMTSELSNITVSEGPQEEKRKIESWLSQPPEMMEFLGKTGTEEVGDDDEVADTNVINKGNGETDEGDVFSKSLSVTDEKSERFTEHSQMTLEGEKSTASIDPVGIKMDPEMIRPTIDKDRKNEHGSSLLDAPVEETTSEKAGPDVGEIVEENMSISSKEASQEAVELTEKINDSTSNEDVFFHEVDNLETSDKESESGVKDIVKESQQEAEHKNEILENIATADSDQSKTSKLDEIDDKKIDVSFGQPLDSPEDNVVVEEQEKTETSTHEEQSGHNHMQKTEREGPADSKEIETEGATKYDEVITNIEEQRPAGSPEEIAGEERKDERVISYDIDKNETQEVNNITTVDSDEKTRSAELEIPNKSGSESWITHPPTEEEVQVAGEKQDEVSMSESGDSREAIQIPSEEEKHVNETFEATKSPNSTILEHTATEVTSTSEMDVNTEKGCELKSEDALKEINPEDNMEEESKKQIEKVSDTEVLVQRKSDDNERSTIEEDIPVKNETPLFSGEEEYRQDQEEKVGSNSFLEEIKETDSGDQSYITSDETNTLNEQIINQEVCEDTQIVDRAEDTEKEMKNDENTDTGFSPEPMGESTIKCSEGNEAEAKKHTAEASEQYDTCGESVAVEESAITDLPPSHVQEEEVEESLIENRREAMISDKEVSNSNNECIEQDFEATHSTKENIGKDLKDEEEENEVLNAQRIIASSEEETAQESNSNLAQSSSVPEIIEKEVNRELLEKEESKDTVEVEEARLTEVEAENSIRVDNSNLMSEAKGQVTTETSEMRSNDIDAIAESSEISIVGDNKTMEIPTERKDGADESTEKTQPEGKSETCDESSKPEDQGEIATVETSLEYKPDQELLESSTTPLEAHNLVTEVSETTGEAPDKVKTLSDKEETPLVAETTEEHVAEKEDESLLEENDANMGSIDIGKESTIDDSLHAPLELNSGKSRTESDVELLKGVNAGEEANGSDSGKLETSCDERSSYKEVETDKFEYEEAVNEASQGIEVGRGRIETEKTIQEQADTAMHFEGRSKESVEMEKGTVEFESEAHSCEGSETPTISAQTVKKIDVEDKELASELPNVTANEVPTQEKRNTESWLSQPPETPEILETECMQVAPNFEVGNVNVVDKGNVGTTESESFLKSTSVDDEKLSGFQEEEEKAKMIKDENVIVEASYGQDGGVGIQSPELTEGSRRDVEIPNEVLNEETMENITSTETTSVEQDLKETSFEGEDKKSIALEMDPEATQPSTDIEDEKNKVEEMPCHGEKDVCMSTETDEPTESIVGATDRLGSSLVTVPIEETSSTKAGPDVCKNLEENSSMACEDESQETGTLSERTKDDASIEDEVQTQNLESSSVKKVEDLEISKEESETGMKDVDKEKEKEAEDQNISLDNTATADRSLSTEGEDVENPERKSHISDMQPDKSMIRESEDATPPEALTKECEPEVMVVPGEDSVAVEERETTETSKHEEHSEQSLKENAEPANENVGSPMVVASEEFEAISLNDHTEIITNIEEESPVGNPEEILGERKNETNNKEISEAESQSALDLDNNTRSAEIPDNSGDEVCVTHPPMEETVLEGGEKQVSMLQSVDQVHEASTPEFPKDEEKNASDSNEASKSPDSECSISEQTSAEGEVNIETTRSVEEIPVGSQEEIHGQPRKDETMTADDVNNKETPEAENLSAVDLYGIPPSVEETFLEEGEKKNDVSVLESGNQVSKAAEVPREEEKDGDDTYEGIKSPEINILERTSNEGALNMEATSTRSAADITLEKGSELISEDELKELKSEENKEEVTEEKAAVADFQIPTKSDDEENSTIKEESLLKNNIPTCTAEGEYHHDQEDEVMPNRSKEALPALDSREQSLSTSNEIKIINDQIMNEEASNVHGSHGTAPESTTTDECSASDIPSSSIGEDKVEERMKDDIGDETEVSNSTAECIEQTFDAACSTEEREDRILKHEESITESPSEQTTQEGRNLDITENYSSVPDIGGKEVKDEVLEKEDTNVPVAAKETSLTQTEGENVKTVDSSDLVVEEKCLVPTEISEGSNAVTRTAETSILGEDNDVEVPTAREVATVETSLDDVSEQMLEASSIQKSEEHNLVSPEVGETTGEAPEKDSTLYEKAETLSAEETTEDEITEIEDESSHPMKDSNMGSIEKENNYAAVEDREYYTPPEQNIEESTFESDVEPLRNAKSETVEELKSSEKDNPDYETAISGTSEGVETYGGCMDSEKAILEQEDSAKNLEGSSMESDDIEKAPVEFEAETHSSETSEVKSISTLKEEDQNINVVEHDETAKDEDNRRFPETNPTNSEEERQDDENQTIASTDEQINRQDIQEGKREMNEEMEPKFDTQDKINGTQDAILTEKVSTEIESASEREPIKEQNTEEESCTKELHMSPAADGTINEVPTVLESTSESEIIEGQNTEEESCTKELHMIKLADETVDEVRDLDLTPIQSLEATASNKNDEIMRSEAIQKEVNETEDAFSTEEVSRETSPAMDEVTCPDLTAIHSLEATASNNITEMMESKTAQDLNEESLEDETKNIEMPVDVSSLVSEGSEEKMKGEKIEDMESGNEETDIASTVVTDLSSLGEVQLNDEPVKAIDASSDADAGEQKLEETAEKSDANDVEVEVTKIPDSVVQTEDQAVKEIHETRTSLNAIDADTREIEQQIREVPEVVLKPTNQHGDQARDEEIIPGQAPQVEKTEEQLQVPSAGLLSEEQESETTTRIEKGGTNEDAMEGAKMHQAEVSMVSKGIDSASERETIKEQTEESCTNELHMSPVTDGTVNEVPTVLESTSESEIIKGQIMEEESCTKELHKITLADEVRDADLTPIQSLEATASNKNDEMMRLDIAEDINMESEATHKEVNETQDAFSTEEVSRETSSATDEVTYPDQTAIHSLEATASNKITEMMESKTAQDLNEESEASPMAEVLEDETKNIEKPGDVSSLISEGSEEKKKGEKIEDMESGNDETDIASTVVTDLSSLGEVQLNDEPVKAVDTSSDAVSLRTTETADAGEQELEETAEKSDANGAEVEVTEIPDSVVQTEDQAVKEIHETGTSLNAIDADTQEIEQQIREVPEVLLEPTNQRGDEARDEEIIPGQAPQVEKTEEQLQVPSAGLLSEEQESETTIRIEKGGTNEEAMEEAKMRQDEVSMIREELETTSEGEGIGNQVQGEEKRVQDFAEELDADSSRDNVILTKMSAQEVLETNHGGEDTDEPVKAIVTSSDTGSLQTTETSDASQQELEEKSSMVSPFPVEEHEKSENISVNVDKSDAYDVEEKEFEIHGDVPEGKDQKVQEIQGTGASLAVEEAHTNETANQNREAPEGFSEAINQGVDAPSEDEIIAPAVAMEVTNLGEVQLNEHVETLDANSGAKNLDTIKTVDASQQNAEFDNMKLEETCIMASQPPIHEHEKVDKENIPPEKSEANYIELEETKIPERVPEYQDQAVKDIHETGTSLDVGDSDTNEIEKPISEVPQALMEPKNQCVDTARDDEITSVPILRGEKLEEQLQAPSSGLLSKEQERETTTANEKGSTDKDAIEGTTVLQAEIREELEATREGKGTENQVQAEEKRVQDWSTIYSAEELDTKSSEDNAMIPKMSREEVLETNPDGHDTDEHVKASDTENLQTTQTPNASQQELEETYSMVSQLPVHEYEKADNQSVTAEKSDAHDVEVKEIDLPGVAPESKDQRVEEIHEVGTRVEETQTNEMETQIRKVREDLSADVSQSVETISGDEIIAPSEATKVTTVGELQLNDEHVEAPETIKTADASQQDAQFDSMKHEEISAMVSQLPIHEDDKEESENRPVEKSDAYDVEVEEAEIHDTVPESEDQAVKEIHEASTSLTAGGADTNEIEKQIRVPEALSEAINPDFDTSRDDEMTPVHTLRAEKTEEQLQVQSSGLFSKEEDGETSTEIGRGTTVKDGTEVGNLELQENSGLVFQLPITEVNSANKLIEEKSDADEVGVIETKNLDAVSESKDQVCEAIHDIGTMPTAEVTETDKVEEEIKEVTEQVPDPGHKGGDAATDGENLNHPLPVGKLEEQTQFSPSSYESTKEDATELNESELEEATDMLSKLPTTEHGIYHVGTTIEKSEADEVQVEDAKTSEAISESEGDGFEEIKEIGSSLPVGKTCIDEVKEETKAVPEAIFEPNYEGAQTAIDVETAINQTLTSQGVEQLQDPKSTTEKPCLQDEGLRELEVSNLEPKVQDSQDISAEEENTGLEKSSTDAPSEFEESPIQGSSQEASTDEDIVYLKNSNKDADYLPPPYPTVTELSTEDKGGKSEEASNLEFEKNGKVLLESVSAVNSLEAPLTTEGIEVKEEYPLETATELGDDENHCEETTEEEAIEKHTSKEKTTEEMQGSRNFDPVSLGEETATKTNQEGILMAEDYPGERTNVIFEASRNEVQHEMAFEESQEAGADRSTEEAVTADDKGPYQLSVGDEIANVTLPEEAKDGQNIQKISNESELKSHGDETDSIDAATEAAAQIKELKSSEAMLVSHEVERIGDNVEETVISKDRKLQNTAPDVPPEADAAAEKAPDGQELQTFDDFCEPALEGPPHGFTEPYEHKKEIVNTGTIDSESLVDTEKPEHTFLEPGCEGTGGAEDLDLTNKDGSNEPSISSATATSQETIADEESEKAVDAKQHGFMSDEPTAEPAGIPEEGFQLEENTMDKEAVELSALGDKRKLDEAKIQTITAIEDEETQQENDGLPHIEDSEKEVSHEKVLMNIPEDVQGPEETSLAMPHEQIASKTDPSESIERTKPTASKDAPVMQDNAAAKTFQNVEVEDLNAGCDVGSEPEAKGMECAEENRMGEKSEEITEDSQKIESAKMSLTDLLQRSTKRNSQVVEDLTEERELMGKKEEPQNATAETVQAEEAEVHEPKDEEEEVDEHKREDSGSDAPVMVEASRDMDVKTVHKKSHHNILSGVGSKVKHSLAKVKKAITGKSSHPKPTSPK